MVSSKRVAATAAAILSIRSATASATPTQVELAFKDFKAKYGRVYKTSEEEADRFRVFEKKFQLVQEVNSKNMSYFLTLNAFSDQETEEFQSSHLGMKAPKSTGKLWKGVTRLGTDGYSGKALPDSVDWVPKGAVTPVKNQGTCGSCWAFSTTGSMEGAWQLHTKKLVSLSEQFLVDCDTDGNNGCSGGSMDSAFDFLKDQDFCTESSYPYTQSDGTCTKSKCTAGIPKGSVKGYFDVPTDDTNALMEAVAQQPVSVGIEADQDAFQQYGGGIVSKNCGHKLDHGVLIVGYGTDKGMKYWKVKNSWGADWGEDGYIRIERGVAGDGMCGIKGMASYPKVDSSPSPAPTPPSPSPPSPTPTPPSPTPTPSPPSPSGCHDSRDYCKDKDIFNPKADCDLLADLCMKTCDCCDDATAPDWCNQKMTPTKQAAADKASLEKTTAFIQAQAIVV